MSMWTYAVCHDCKEKIWLEKLLGYIDNSDDLATYHVLRKLVKLSKFWQQHEHCPGAVVLFTEYTGQHVKTADYKDVDDKTEETTE